MHWRNSGNHAVFLMVDARASFPPLILFIAHISYWTFSLWIFSILFFAALRYKGYTVPSAFRMVKAKMAGNIRYSKPWWRRPEMVRTPRE